MKRKHTPTQRVEGADSHGTKRRKASVTIARRKRVGSDGGRSDSKQDPTLPERLPTEVLTEIISYLDAYGPLWARLVATHWKKAVDQLPRNRVPITQDPRNRHPPPGFLLRLTPADALHLVGVVNMLTDLTPDLRFAAKKGAAFVGIRSTTTDLSKEFQIQWQLPCEVVHIDDEGRGSADAHALVGLQNFRRSMSHTSGSRSQLSSHILEYQRSEGAVLVYEAGRQFGAAHWVPARECDPDENSLVPTFAGGDVRSATFRFHDALALADCLRDRDDGVAFVIGRGGGGELALSICTVTACSCSIVASSSPQPSMSREGEPPSVSIRARVGIPVVAMRAGRGAIRAMRAARFARAYRVQRDMVPAARVTLFWRDKREGIWCDKYPVAFDVLFRDAGLPFVRLDSLDAGDGPAVRVVFCHGSLVGESEPGWDMFETKVLGSRRTL